MQHVEFSRGKHWKLFLQWSHAVVKSHLPWLLKSSAFCFKNIVSHQAQRTPPHPQQTIQKGRRGQKKERRKDGANVVYKKSVCLCALQVGIVSYGETVTHRVNLSQFENTPDLLEFVMELPQQTGFKTMTFDGIDTARYVSYPTCP